MEEKERKQVVINDTEYHTTECFLLTEDQIKLLKHFYYNNYFSENITFNVIEKQNEWQII